MSATTSATSTSTIGTAAQTPVTTGNQIMPPPRLSGNNAQDMTIMLRWIQALYNELVINVNVQGSISSLQTAVAALQADIPIIASNLDLLNTATGVTPTSTLPTSSSSSS